MGSEIWDLDLRNLKKLTDPLLDFSVMFTGEVLVEIGVTEITGEVRAAADTFVGEVLLFTTRVLCFLFMDPFGEDPLLDFSDPLLDFSDPLLDFSDPLLDFSDPLLDFSDPLLDFSVMLTGEVLVVVGVTEVTGEAFVGEVLLFTTAVLLFLDPFGLIPGIFVGDLGFLAGLKKENRFSI